MSTLNRITILALGAIVALAAVGAPSANAGQATRTAAQTTALLVSATNAPLRVLGSDGQEHLEYDLIITNVFTVPVTLTAVEVTTPEGRTLLRLAGDELAAYIQPLLFQDAPTLPLVPVGGVVAVVIDLVVPPGQVPARISHRIAYDLPADAPGITLFDSRAVIGPELVVHPAPLVIAPPLRGAGWFNANGCCVAETPHRSARIAVDGAHYVKFEMFAIDWGRLQDGRPFAGDGSRNEQYFAFGAEVVSVAAGTVVAVRDDMPDGTPNQPQPPASVQHPADYAGNNVVVQIQPDVWAVYGHLQAGSVAVRVGERVTTGQLLGRLGNSGNSSIAHLHFALTDGPDPVTSNSLPFVFDQYTLVGTVDAESYVAALTDRGAAAIIAGPPSTQTDTYPLVLTVQDFP